VARNPYEPPTSPVTEPRRPRGQPPEQVVWSVWLLRLSLIIGYASLFLMSKLPVAISGVPAEARSSTMGIFFVTLALTAMVYLWLIQCIKDGRNWARILMLALTVLGVFSTLMGSSGEAPALIRAISIIDTIIDVTAMVLLFRAPGAFWFAPPAR
jgi:hypothetical protein